MIFTCMDFFLVFHDSLQSNAQCQVFVEQFWENAPIPYYAHHHLKKKFNINFITKKLKQIPSIPHP